MTDELLNRLPEWEREAQEHEQKAQALRKIIEGVRALNGDAGRLFGLNGAAPAKATRSKRATVVLRGRKAVLAIMRDRPGDWPVREVKEQMLKRGWPYSASGVEAACKRLAEEGQIERLGRGLYRFGAPAAPKFVPMALGEEVVAA